MHPICQNATSLFATASADAWCGGCIKGGVSRLAWKITSTDALQSWIHLLSFRVRLAKKRLFYQANESCCFFYFMRCSHRHFNAQIKWSRMQYFFRLHSSSRVLFLISLVLRYTKASFYLSHLACLSVYYVIYIEPIYFDWNSFKRIHRIEIQRSDCTRRKKKERKKHRCDTKTANMQKLKIFSTEWKMTWTRHICVTIIMLGSYAWLMTRHFVWMWISFVIEPLCDCELVLLNGKKSILFALLLSHLIFCLKNRNQTVNCCATAKTSSFAVRIKSIKNELNVQSMQTKAGRSIGFLHSKCGAQSGSMDLSSDTKKMLMEMKIERMCRNGFGVTHWAHGRYTVVM